MSFSLLTVVQQSDGAVNTLGYFDAAFAVQAAQGLRNSIVNVAFKVNNGNALCSATASLDPGAATVACPVTMGHPPNTQCVVAQCRNAPDSVPRGSQFYLIMDWGVCRSDTPAVTCRQWSENVLVSFNRLSSVQSSSTLASAAATVPTSTATGDSKTNGGDTSQQGNSNSGQQQQPQQPQKGVAQDNSVAITVPIVSIVAIAAGVFLFIKYRNLHRAKKRLQQTDLAAVFQSLNNTVPSSSKPVLPSSSNARSNQSIMSAAPLIIKGKGGTSVHSSSVSARSNATLEQTPAYLDDESDAGTVSSFGPVDHVQFGQTANVTPSVYQSPNPSPFANYAYPPPVSTTTSDARTQQQQQPQYPGYYDQHGNYYFFATPSVPVIPFPVVPPSVSSTTAAVGQVVVVPPVPAPSIPLPPSPVTSSNRRLPDEGAGDRK
ncbi:hypothetical protein HDU77_006818 [Chytriomyces hyalinus]|nr:hypothetical protein HDU77_006818 [Chytriomyces hyalinus]